MIACYIVNKRKDLPIFGRTEKAAVILSKNLSKRMGQWIWSGVQWQMDAMRREASSAVGETWNKVWRMVYLVGKVYVWVCRMFRFFGKR